MENTTSVANEQTRTLTVIAVLTIVCYCLLVGVTVAGNLLVIVGFWREPALQAITNYWIVSLSLTDICLACTVIPFQIVKETHHGFWQYGELWCDVFICLDVLCCTCSIYHLALISLDRYLCIRFPVSYPLQRTSTRTVLAIIFSWLLCTLVAIPRLFGWKDMFIRGHCELRSKSYTLFSSLVSFYVPLFLIMCMYVAIYRATRRRAKQFSRDFGTSRRVVANRSSSVPILLKTAIAMRNKKDSAIISVVGPTIRTDLNTIHELINNDDHSNGSQSSITQIQDEQPTRNNNRLLHNVQRRLVGLLTRSQTTEWPLDIIRWYTRSSRRHSTPSMCAPSGLALAALVQKQNEHTTVMRRRKQMGEIRLIKRRKKQENRTAKVVIIVLGAFVLFWTPFFTFNIVSPWCTDCFAPSTSNAVWRLVIFWGYVNSAVNPFIYTYFNRTFRRAIYGVIKCEQRGRH